MKKHEGFNSNRLSKAADNPREVAFAKAWRNNNGKGPSHSKHTIDYLIPECTVRDEQVAATIIQWLGSNVGMAFLREVVLSNKNIRDFLPN